MFIEQSQEPDNLTLLIKVTKQDKAYSYTLYKDIIGDLYIECNHKFYLVMSHIKDQFCHQDILILFEEVFYYPLIDLMSIFKQKHGGRK